MDACGFLWVCCFEDGEAFAEAGCVFVGDGEDADAALRTARVTDEMMASAFVCVGYRGVYDLDEGLRHGAFMERFARCANAHISESRFGHPVAFSSYGTCGSAIRLRE